MIRLGIEELCRNPPPHFANRRLGLLCNQASTNAALRHSRDLIEETFPAALRCLFSPQHGFFSEKQDNMVESGHCQENSLPVYSLYSETRKPHPSMLADIDTLLVDLVDVGTRVYTFAWTVVLCLEAAKESDIRVIILDRPNPIGGHLIEGNLMSKECVSFVGQAAIPMRHGLTLGELALFCNQELGIGANLAVIRAEGWRRRMLFPQTGLPWIFPSPNMPSFRTAQVYPGQVIWEGTNISEGRGTTLPFELFGAPFVQPDAVLFALRDVDLPGCLLRPIGFEPTSGKWAGQMCRGFQIHVVDSRAFRPYRTSLALYQSLRNLYPDDFAYKDPPYEYEYKRLPMDLILGSRQLREDLEAGMPVMEMEERWLPKLKEFRQKCQAVFLYD